MLARLTHEELAAAVLTFWPHERLHWRQRGSRYADNLRLLAILLLAVGQVLVNPLFRKWVPATPVLAFYGSGSIVVSIALMALLMIRRAPSVLPLLARLDDVRLVPYWLEELGGLPKGLERSALLERLSRHLPYWHATGEPLPDAAREALQGQIEYLAGKSWSEEEAAFLTAVLVSLDDNADRGVRIDDATRRRLPTLLHDHRNEPVRIAAEDALQRLGVPPR